MLFINASGATISQMLRSELTLGAGSFPENHLCNEYIFPPDSVPKYLEELSKLNVWISKRVGELFASEYCQPETGYIDRYNKRNPTDPPGNRGF